MSTRARAHRLVVAYGQVYSMTTRQWLAFVKASAAGNNADIPGRYIGNATTINDLEPRDFSYMLDEICATCGHSLPRKPSTVEEAEAERPATLCENCTIPIVHSLRMNARRAKEREETEP